MFSEDLFQLSQISTKTQKHLTKVYLALATGLLSSVLTFVIFQNLAFSTFFYYIFFIISIASLIADIVLIFSNKDTSFYKKLNLFSFYGYAISLGGLLGTGIANLTKYDKLIFNQLSLQALFMTSLIFISFTMFSILTSNRLAIYSGATLLTFILSIFSFFIWNVKFEIIIGIIIACLYIIADSQKIILNCENNNNNNAFQDAKMLFVDFAQIFIKILMYLLKKKEDEEEEKRRKKN